MTANALTWKRSITFAVCSGSPDTKTIWGHLNSSLRALMPAMRSKRPDPSSLTFYAFDLLHLNGADLTGKWLIERKQRLRALAERTGMAVPSMYLVDHFDDEPASASCTCRRCGNRS
jgi:hypothetical protein